MDALLIQKVDLLAENYFTLKKNFKWEAALVNHFGAMVHTTKGMRVNVELFGEVKRYLKEETNWTSQFRGTNLHILSNLLCMEDNYKKLFTKITNLYEQLRNAGFKNSAQLPLSAFTLAKEVETGKMDSSIERMNAFYKRMKENHFWITSSDDYVYAAILATTDRDVEKTVDDIEKCYKMLNEGGLQKGNYLQTLSHILALGEESTALKCQKAIKIFYDLKEKKCNLNYHGLASVGVMALIATNTDKIVNEVKETYDYLYGKDGYGYWGIDKTTRSILAATLVSDFYLDGIQKGILQVTLGNSVNAIIIAQQSAAVTAACAASAAATSAT